MKTTLKHGVISISTSVGCGGVRLETRPDVSVFPGPQPRGYQGNINTVCAQTDKGMTP